LAQNLATSIMQWFRNNALYFARLWACKHKMVSY